MRKGKYDILLKPSKKEKYRYINTKKLPIENPVFLVFFIPLNVYIWYQEDCVINSSGSHINFTQGTVFSLPQT